MYYIVPWSTYFLRLLLLLNILPVSMNKEKSGKLKFFDWHNYVRFVSKQIKKEKILHSENPLPQFLLLKTHIAWRLLKIYLLLICWVGQINHGNQSFLWSYSLNRKHKWSIKKFDHTKLKWAKISSMFYEFAILKMKYKFEIKKYQIRL